MISVKTLAGLASVALVCIFAASLMKQSQPILSRSAIRTGAMKATCPTVMRTMGGNALAGTKSDLSSRLSTPTKCIKADSRVSVCNNGLVVLRPSLAVRAAEDKTFDADTVIEDLSAKWDAIENKSQVAIYAGGAVVALVTANAVVTTIDSIPFVPYFTEVVGTCYSLWFAYRYLLFEDSRKELVKDIEVLLEKIGGKE
mmetsp:Transcript_251/g.394  ORF Transcript_251/g.394 Transcript_251/m.394 type:complete len:199 (-) Transcript_251:326-922(-)